MTDIARTREQRRADTLARLAAPTLDAWVATDGPYLVPLTLAWFENRLIAATDRTSRTAKTLIETGRARIGIGPTRDVVMVDATLDHWLPVTEAPEIGEAYARQNDWDPRTAGPTYIYPDPRTDPNPGVAGGERDPRPHPDEKRHVAALTATLPRSFPVRTQPRNDQQNAAGVGQTAFCRGAKRSQPAK
ncbi:hypothetical protein [Actinoplanes philippinensis]|uniref:hypothetical protein n=1 Tax=Actinoplanes philippinensis TaxID=35752 RepID=UPI0033F3F0D2